MMRERCIILVAIAMLVTANTLWAQHTVQAGNRRCVRQDSQWHVLDESGAKWEIAPGYVEIKFSSMDSLPTSRTLKTTAKAEEALACKLRVTVTGSVTFDPQTKLYTYAYQVENQYNSVGSVEWFGIRPLLVEPVSWTAPDHWSGEYGYVKEEPTGFIWWISDPGPPPPDWVDEGGNTYASEYGAEPSETLTFSVSLPVAPGLVDFTVQAWTYVEPVPEGTAWSDPNQTFFSMGATGTIVGPGNDPTGAGDDQRPNN